MPAKYGPGPWSIFVPLFGIAATVMVLVWTLKFRGGLAFRSRNQELIFNVHPVLMVIGFIVSSGHAIVVFKILPARRKAQKAVHLLLHLVALLAGVVGVYVAFKFKRESGLKDMSSLHSWFGMATICLYGLQWLLAFLFFWFPGAAMYTRARIVPWHVFAGLVIFLMAICAAELGILEKLTFLERAKAVRIFGEEALLVNFMGIAILFFAIAVGLCLFL